MQTINKILNLMMIQKQIFANYAENVGKSLIKILNNEGHVACTCMY